MHQSQFQARRGCYGGKNSVMLTVHCFQGGFSLIWFLSFSLVFAFFSFPFLSLFFSFLSNFPVQTNPISNLKKLSQLKLSFSYLSLSWHFISLSWLSLFLAFLPFTGRDKSSSTFLGGMITIISPLGQSQHIHHSCTLWPSMFKYWSLCTNLAVDFEGQIIFLFFV